MIDGQKVRIADFSEEQQLLPTTCGRLATVVKVIGPFCVVNVENYGLRGCFEDFLIPVITQEVLEERTQKQE